MTRSKVAITIGFTFLLELLLAGILTILSILVVGYVSVNAVIFENLSLASYGNGWESVWLFIFFFSDVLFFIILCLIFIEAALLTLRTMVIRGIKAVEKIKNKIFDKAIGLVKTVSLVSLVKLVKINTPKRALISYVIVMVVVFGSGWIAKSVLKNYESPVYRAYQNINLDSDLDEFDFSGELTEEQTYDITIDAGVANVHLYSVTNSTDLKIYYLFDNELQQADYSLSVDTTLDIIDIQANLAQTAYEKYVDPVLPSVEIYLPDAIHIDSLTINIGIFGSLTIQYIEAETLTADVHNADVSIKAEELRIGTIDLKQLNGKLELLVEESDDITLVLDGVYGDVSAKSVTNTLSLSASSNSNIFMYQTVGDAIILNALESAFELREVRVANDITANDAITIDLNDSELIFVNANSGNMTIATISSVSSVVTLRGVENATSGD